MEEKRMGTMDEKSTLTSEIKHPVDGFHPADDLGAKAIFRIAGNRVFRIDPLPRGKMADVPLQKSKIGLTSADVLDYLREETAQRSEC
ncbi:MAG: hypothetical protein LBQ46_07010 [Treponema sp.]|jgi:hypothetical protein|nr:hypothetical protein [Treponema sp.]